MSPERKIIQLILKVLSIYDRYQTHLSRLACMISASVIDGVTIRCSSSLRPSDETIFLTESCRRLTVLLRLLCMIVTEIKRIISSSTRVATMPPRAAGSQEGAPRRVWTVSEGREKKQTINKILLRASVYFIKQFLLIWSTSN